MGVPAWAVWIVVAALLGAGEIATTGLFILGPIAVAAGVGALVAALGGAAWIQLVVFAVAATAGVAVLRPIARRHLHVPAALRTGTAALVGAKATVVERVDANGGRVKIGGEIWSARAFDDTAVIEAGTQVDVVKIEGATALVYE
jgi:membrane protein implicated in regulation of membrane protease activity